MRLLRRKRGGGRLARPDEGGLFRNPGGNDQETVGKIHDPSGKLAAPVSSGGRLSQMPAQGTIIVP